jgi:hypothetical protein
MTVMDDSSITYTLSDPVHEWNNASPGTGEYVAPMVTSKKGD